MLDILSFIKHAHEGQTYGSHPYWMHPYSVMKVGETIFGSNFGETEKETALLHDVPEDTKYQISDLHNLGVKETTLKPVDLVTKVPGLTYKQNIDRIVRSGNKSAMRTKFADNLVNYLGDKSSWSHEKRESSQKKYYASMMVLAKALGIEKHPVVEMLKAGKEDELREMLKGILLN